MWQSQKDLESLLIRFCKARGVELDEFVVLDVNDNLVDYAKTLGELRLPLVRLVEKNSQEVGTRNRNSVFAYIKQAQAALTPKADADSKQPDGVSPTENVSEPTPITGIKMPLFPGI